MRQSGGLAEITTLSKLSGLTRPTVMNYLVTPFVTHPYDKAFGELLVHVLPLDRLLTILIEKNI